GRPWAVLFFPTRRSSVLLMSGVGTLIFFLFVRGQVPSYLGSSFAFIGGVIAVTGYAGSGPNPTSAIALGGIVACGPVYTLVGLLDRKSTRLNSSHVKRPH